MVGLDENVLITSITLAAVSFLFFSLRLYTRFFVARDPGLPEFCITISVACNVIMCILIAKASTLGFGKYSEQSPDTRLLTKFLWASVITYNLGVAAVKVSILLQYLRIFATASFRVATWMILIITGTYGIWSVLVTVFNCYPVASFWVDVKPNGQCLNTSVVWLADAMINTTLNFAILVLPTADVFEMRMQRRQKALLMLIFVLGLSVTVFSGLRLRSALSVTRETLGSNTSLVMWSSIELSLGITVSSTLSLRSLCIRLFPDLFGPPSCPSPTPSHLSNYFSHFPGRHCPDSRHLHYYNDTLSQLVASGSRDVELLGEAKITASASAARVSSDARPSAEDREINVVTTFQQTSEEWRLELERDRSPLSLTSMNYLGNLGTIDEGSEAWIDNKSVRSFRSVGSR